MEDELEVNELATDGNSVSKITNALKIKKKIVSIKLAAAMKPNDGNDVIEGILNDINEKRKKLNKIYNDLVGKEGTPNKMDNIELKETPKELKIKSQSPKSTKTLATNATVPGSIEVKETLIIDDSDDNDIDMDPKHSAKKRKATTNDDIILEDPPAKRRKLNSKYQEMLARYKVDDNDKENEMKNSVDDNDDTAIQQQPITMNTNDISKNYFMEIKKKKYFIDPPTYVYDSISKDATVLGQNEIKILDFLKLNEVKDILDENHIKRFVKHVSKKKNTNECKTIAELALSYKKRRKTIKKPPKLQITLEYYICKMIWGDANEKNAIVNTAFQVDYTHYCTYINSLLVRIAMNNQMEQKINEFVVRAKQDIESANQKMKTAKKAKKRELNKNLKDAKDCIAISENQLNEIQESNKMIKSLVAKIAVHGCYICGNYMFIYNIASMGQHVPNCLRKSNK